MEVSLEHILKMWKLSLRLSDLWKAHSRARMGLVMRSIWVQMLSLPHLSDPGTKLIFHSFCFFMCEKVAMIKFTVEH